MTQLDPLVLRVIPGTRAHARPCGDRREEHTMTPTGIYHYALCRAQVTLDESDCTCADHEPLQPWEIDLLTSLEVTR